MTIEEMAARFKENEKKWDALPEKEKQRQRRLLAGWADRIDAENEALGLQFEEELKKMTPEELKAREERVKKAIANMKKKRPG